MSTANPSMSPGGSWTRTLYVYIARTYLTRFAILLIGIGAVLLTLDILSESGRIMAGEGAGSGSVLRYTFLRFPQILSQLPPFTALLASLVTLGALARNSEVTVMQASGLSPIRIVAPMMAVNIAIAGAHFMFNELVVVDAGNELANWESVDFSMVEEVPPERIADAWASEDGTLVRVQEVGASGALLFDITLYRFAQDGELNEIIKADFGGYKEGKWTLFDVTRLTLAQFEREEISSMDWSSGISPDRFLALSVEPERVTFGELWDAARLLSGDDRPDPTIIAWLHHKIAGPFASIIMPLLGALAGFGVMRSGRMFIRVAIAMGLGFAFFVSENLLLALGKFAILPPALAVWSPFLLFTAIGGSILIYAEE